MLLFLFMFYHIQLLLISALHVGTLVTGFALSDLYLELLTTSFLEWKFT
jgi:hypothetical protein